MHCRIFNTTVQVYGMNRTDFDILSAVEKTPASSPVIYPVPARDFLRIRNVNNISRAEILDPAGRLIRSTNLTSDEEVNIPVSDLKQGIYFLRLTTPEGILIRKFVK